MDLKRAEQIVSSAKTFTVLHNGAPVWIDSLNRKRRTAKVKPLGNQGGFREVPVTELVEG